MVESRRFHPILCLLFISLIVLGVVARPSPLRRLYFLPILLLTLYILPSTTGDFVGDYYLGVTWLPWCFFASDYILLRDQRTLHRVPLNRRADSPDVKENSANIADASLWQRLKWSIALLSSPRGIGWSHDPTHALPPRPSPDTSRTSFVLTRLWTAFGFFVLNDACNIYMSWNTMYHVDGPEWTACGWGWRALAGAGWAINIYSSMMLNSSLLSAGCVALGISSPREWPALYGGPKEAYTVRRFWGRAWHQLMRSFLTSHGKFVSNTILRLPPGNLASYLQLYIAFAISGLIHHAGDAMAMRNGIRGGGSVTFFMLQACAITFEDFLIFLGKKTFKADSDLRKVKKSWVGLRLVGYVWTWWWLALTLPGWLMPQVRGGLMDGQGLPVSLLLGIWRGEWVRVR
ncbi:MBOAT-2 domain-containing protein [Favolaschia claudopus]|uniref:MBOAT-2 domain-containing protein n=1 Tax=Favolaschia claudopus TaxID=2862362 RepID=A0AAW0CC84_9AGAR